MKVYIVNEHHEAFFIIREEYRRTNIEYNLINIDEHHDLGRAIVNMNKFNDNTLHNDKNITYNDLRVSDFIVPLIYLNVIKEVIWINNNRTSSKKSIFIQTEYNKQHMILKPNFTDEHENDAKFSVKNLFSGLESLDNIILSIDLDFFAFDNDAGESAQIEVTEEEYVRFMKNKYHKIRLNFGSQIKAHKINNKFYLKFNNIDGEETNGFRDRESIDILIGFLENYLKNSNIKPKCIVVSRSNYSGYTYQENYQYIYDNVLEMVNNLYKESIEEWWDLNDATNQWIKF